MMRKFLIMLIVAFQASISYSKYTDYFNDHNGIEMQLYGDVKSIITMKYEGIQDNNKIEWLGVDSVHYKVKKRLCDSIYDFRIEDIRFQTDSIYDHHDGDNLIASAVTMTIKNLMDSIVNSDDPFYPDSLGDQFLFRLFTSCGYNIKIVNPDGSINDDPSSAPGGWNGPYVYQYMAVPYALVPCSDGCCVIEIDIIIDDSECFGYRPSSIRPSFTECDVEQESPPPPPAKMEKKKNNDRTQSAFTTFYCFETCSEDLIDLINEIWGNQP